MPGSQIELEQRRGRQAPYVLKKCRGTGHVFPRQVLPNRIKIEPARHPLGLQQYLDLGAEYQPLLDAGVVKRLDADVIARQHEFALAPIEQRDRKHAV